MITNTLKILLIFFIMIGGVMAADIANVLSSISGKYDIVWAYNASDTKDPWKRYAPGAVDNDLTYMTPGSGYWIKMNQGAVLLVE